MIHNQKMDWRRLSNTSISLINRPFILALNHSGHGQVHLKCKCVNTVRVERLVVKELFHRRLVKKR